MNIKDEAVVAAAEAIKNGRPFRHAETARAALTAALPHMGGVMGEVTYEIENEEGEFCAGSNSLADAQHYAMVYGQDHPVRLIEVTRRVISSPFALASHEPAPDTLEPADDTLGANLGSTLEPTKDGPEVVERVRKWCSETINQWSDEYEPRENWERQVSGAMREWDKATTEIISDYEALRVENERLRAASIASGNALYEARTRNAELVKALEKIIEGKEVPDPLDDGRSTIMTDLDLDEIDQIARAALEGQSNEA